MEGAFKLIQGKYINDLKMQGQFYTLSYLTRNRPQC